MEALRINGNKRLSGEVIIDGSKNAAVALIPAAILAKGVVIIENVPHIDDVDNLVTLLNYLNVEVIKNDNTLTIDSSKIENKPLLKDQVRLLRASYYFMGALISLFKEVTIAAPGGCAIGSRPVDLHVDVFKQLGIQINVEDKVYYLTRKEYQGTLITFKKISVGATINLILASIGANGTTIIENPAKEPEVNEVISMLIGMGARIYGAGTNKIVIEGNYPLHGVKHKVIPDRIEAGTYLIIGAAIGDQIIVKNINPSHLKSLLNVFSKIDVKYQVGVDFIKILKSDRLKNTNIITQVYPGFPTDLQQPISTLLTKSIGSSYVKETIYPDRVAHVKELNKMNAGIQVIDNLLMIKGPCVLVGAKITAKDLRGGASLLLAGLMAQGQTILTGIQFIKRGYGGFVYKLKQLGADIDLIEVDDNEN